MVNAVTFATAYDSGPFGSIVSPSKVNLIRTLTLPVPAIAPCGAISYWYKTSLLPDPSLFPYYSCGIVSAQIAPPASTAINAMHFQVAHTFTVTGMKMNLILCGGTDQTKFYNGMSDVSLPTDGLWHHVFIAWSMGGPLGGSPPVLVARPNPPLQGQMGIQSAYFYLDGVQRSFVPSSTLGGGLPLTGPGGAFSLQLSSVGRWNVGYDPQSSVGGGYVGDMAEMYVYLGDYFVDGPHNKEVNTPWRGPLENTNFALPIGPRGEMPLGIVPAIFLKGTAGTFLGNSTGIFSYSSLTGAGGAGVQSIDSHTLTTASSDPFGP